MNTPAHSPTAISLWIAAIIACGSIASAQQAPPAASAIPFERGVQINVVASKPAKGTSYYSDKTQRIVLTVKFTNTDARQSYEGYTATISVLAKGSDSSKIWKVLMQEKVDLTLPPRQTQTHVSEEVVTRFYKSGNYKSGYSYDGWLLVVKDAADKVVQVKSTSASLEKFTELAAKVKLGGYYDFKLKPVKYSSY